MPPPRRRMTVPSKTWMRSRLPSTTLADTFTVSPVASSGRSVRSWSWTISSSTFTRRFLDSSWAAVAAGGVVRRAARTARPAAEYSTGLAAVSRRRPASASRSGRRAAGPRRAPARAASARTAPWSPEVEDRPARPCRGTTARPRVLRVLEQPARERLLRRSRPSSMAPGQQAEHGVDDDERRQLAAGQHVVADRQLEVDQRRGSARRRPRSAGRRR